MKKLSLKDIKSGVLMGSPEKITVQIKLNGEDCEFDTYILPFSYETAVAQMRAYGEKKEALAGILASVICDEKGKVLFTEQEIRTKFNQAFVDSIWVKITEINLLGKKPSLPKTMNSSSKLELPLVKPTTKSKRSKSPKLKSIPLTPTSTEVSTQVEE